MKKIAIISAVILSLIMSTSCFNSKTSYVSDQLQKKYNKQFAVNLVSGSITTNEYRCHPKDGEDITFKAELINGKEIVDGYEEALLGAGITQRLYERLPELEKNSAVKVYVKKGADGFTDLGSTVDFIRKSDGVRFNTIIAADKTVVDEQKILDDFKALIQDMKSVSGTLVLSMTDKASIPEIRQIMAEADIATNKLLDACGEDAAIINFENGIFDITSK